ncbi:MAG: hypothetical protein ACOX60_06280 [Massiliimalia sp.]
MSLPAIIWILINMIGLGVALAQHGKLKIGKYNVFSTIIAAAIEFGLLWWGGFFG